MNSFPQLELLLQSHLKDGMVGSGSYGDICEKFCGFGSILDIHSSRLCECKEPSRRQLVKANVGGLYLCHEGDVSCFREQGVGAERRAWRFFKS